MRILVEQAALFGALYGIAVYFFMNELLCRFRRDEVPLLCEDDGDWVVIHIFCVGLPIGLSIRRFGN